MCQVEIKIVHTCLDFQRGCGLGHHWRSDDGPCLCDWQVSVSVSFPGPSATLAPRSHMSCCDIKAR